MQKIWIYIITAFVIGFLFAGFIGYRFTSEYKATISNIESTNKLLIKQNKAATEYNKRLTVTIENFKKQLDTSYKIIGDGLGAAAENTGDIEKSLNEATNQISAIINSIQNLIRSIDDI